MKRALAMSLSCALVLASGAARAQPPMRETRYTVRQVTPHSYEVRKEPDKLMNDPERFAFRSSAEEERLKKERDAYLVDPDLRCKEEIRKLAKVGDVDPGNSPYWAGTHARYQDDLKKCSDATNKMRADRLTALPTLTPAQIEAIPERYRLPEEASALAAATPRKKVSTRTVKKSALKAAH